MSRQVVEIAHVFPEFDHGVDAAAAVDGRAPSTAAWKPKSGFHERPHRLPFLRNRGEDLLRRRRQRGCGQLLHRFRAEVASLGDRPLVVLLQQNRADQPDHRLRRGEDPDDIRPTLDLLIQALERIRAVQLSLMLEREVPVREDVFGRLL